MNWNEACATRKRRSANGTSATGCPCAGNWRSFVKPNDCAKGDRNRDVEESGNDGPLHFDAHAYRTEDAEGVWDFARGCMRTYLILKEKAEQFREDQDVQGLLADIRHDAACNDVSSSRIAHLGPLMGNGHTRSVVWRRGWRWCSSYSFSATGHRPTARSIRRCPMTTQGDADPQLASSTHPRYDVFMAPEPIRGSRANCRRQSLCANGS